MKQELINKYHIPTEAIITENKSIDTSQNAKYCAQILQTLQIQTKDIILVTNNFHLPRATQLFKKYFGTITPQAAEEILENYQPKKSTNHYKKLIQKRLESDKHKKLVQTDKIISMIYQLPRGEKVIEALARHQRQ